MPQLRIGCSGWQYRHWRGTFYPETLPPSRWLQQYIEIFDTVEVNTTFYRLPEREAFVVWRQAMPPGFVAAIKASRFLTHMKKLIDPAGPVARLFERAAGLGPRLGPVLYQLPAHLERDLPRLDAFLRELPARLPAEAGAPRRRLRHTIEFRDSSWYVSAVFDRLAAAGVAVCLHDRAGSGVARKTTAPFVYVRYHGSSGSYHGEYTDQQLERQADWLAEQFREGRDIFAYFNNDIGGAAPRNALMLRAAMKRRLADELHGPRRTP